MSEGWKRQTTRWQWFYPVVVKSSVGSEMYFIGLAIITHRWGQWTNRVLRWGWPLTSSKTASPRRLSSRLLYVCMVWKQIHVCMYIDTGIINVYTYRQQTAHSGCCSHYRKDHRLHTIYSHANVTMSYYIILASLQSTTLTEQKVGRDHQKLHFQWSATGYLVSS